MARLVGIGLLLWAVHSTITYSLEHAPRPAAAASEEAVRPSPVEALSEATVDLEPTPPPRPQGPAWRPGAYTVGDSPDARIAARDRDYRPRGPVFSVRGEIQPGLYATAFDAEDCTYELWRVMRDRTPRVIAEEYLAAGRLLVSINGVEPDWFTTSGSCGSWYPWRPLQDPLTEAGNGDYWIGDLAPGVWLVPEPCRWEEVVAFRGAFLRDVIDNGEGPGTLTIDAETLGVRVRGCRAPLRLTEGDI